MTDATEVVAASRPVDLAPAAALFHGLSDPTRLAILQHLSVGEHRVRDLTEHLGPAPSTVSAHLACLRDCGLVVTRQQGQYVICQLSDERVRTLIATAGSLLADVARGVYECTRYEI